jgi:hypothetical protein
VLSRIRLSADYAEVGVRLFGLGFESGKPEQMIICVLGVSPVAAADRPACTSCG